MDFSACKIGLLVTLGKPADTNKFPGWAPVLTPKIGSMVEITNLFLGVAGIYPNYLAIKVPGLIGDFGADPEWLTPIQAQAQAPARAGAFATAIANMRSSYTNAYSHPVTVEFSGETLADEPTPVTKVHAQNPFVRSRETAEFLGFCDVCGGFREHRTYCKARAR